MTPGASTLPNAAALEKPYRLALCKPEEAEAVAAAVEGAAPQEALSASELGTAAGLKTPKRLREWIAARLAAKRLLGWRLQQAGLYLKPSDITLGNREDGMPFARLPGGRVIGDGTLSLSHSAGWGAAAVCEPWALVGVDLETIAPRAASFLELMAHESEWAPWMLADPVEQTRLWTLKEAVAKLLGTGLSVGFWDIRLVLSGEDRRLELHGAAEARWAALGRPIIHFDSRAEDDARILSVAYAARPQEAPL
ncbi:MAG: 4'-phosphopantetheinyl transferase superfamily protein [Elusimicrobia bacterium]|nr:4'-phosphopantetheinyl transferase superfamily protein [Elusimicrobiota bacterium]